MDSITKGATHRHVRTHEYSEICEVVALAEHPRFVALHRGAPFRRPLPSLSTRVFPERAHWLVFSPGRLKLKYRLYLQVDREKGIFPESNSRSSSEKSTCRTHIFQRESKFDVRIQFGPFGQFVNRQRDDVRVDQCVTEIKSFNLRFPVLQQRKCLKMTSC